MNDPLLSVIVPTFNSDPKKTFKGLMSIFNQSYKNFECIIVDDSDKASTIKFLEKFCNSKGNFHYVKGTGGGIAKALNQGIFLAKGQFIARADDTDISDVDRFLIQVKLLKQEENIDVVGSNINIKYQDETITRIYPETHSKIIKRFFVSCPLAHPAVMVRKKIFDDGNNYDESFKYCEDLELWLRLFRNKYNFFNIQKSLVTYEGNLKSRPLKHYIFNTYARFKHLSNPIIFVSAIISLVHFLLPPKLRLKIIKKFQSI